jgi:hypothetical protein
LEEIVAAPDLKTENTAVRIHCADHATPSIRKKLALTSPTCGGRSVGIVRLRAKTTEVFCVSGRRTNGNVLIIKMEIEKY